MTPTTSPTTPHLGIELVPWGPAHRGFVLDSFRAELMEVPPWTSGLVSEHVARLDRHLRHPGSELVAQVARVGTGDDLVGWIARHKGALIFCYVRGIARRKGIARWMIGDYGAWLPVAYWTRAATELAPRLGLVYSPDKMLTNGGGTP